MSIHLDQEGQILLIGCIQERLLAAPMCPGGIVANPAVPHGHQCNKPHMESAMWLRNLACAYHSATVPMHMSSMLLRLLQLAIHCFHYNTSSAVDRRTARLMQVLQHGT